MININKNHYNYKTYLNDIAVKLDLNKVITNYIKQLINK
jgi:hypothetical protein